MKFFGRKEYIEDLTSLWRKQTSSIVACRGRRRIGKSTLFREFARRTADCYIEIEGLAPDEETSKRTAEENNRKQLKHFISVLSAYAGREIAVPSDWMSAFKELDRLIDDSKRTVILLDEVSWMGGYDQDFPGKLRTAWETYLHPHGSLIVAVCGSVSTWIKENILGNTGFTGRFSRDYVLPELSLAECSEFWREARDLVSSRDIFDILSVTGGVPRYLEEVDPGLTAEENIRRMCFETSGELYKDFDAIFNPLYGEESELKRKMLVALSEEPLSACELGKKFALAKNGRIARLLRELKDGGFITDDPRLNPETGEQARVSKYRLRDNYIRFYLKYIAPRKLQIETGTYRFATLASLPDWTAVMGLQFENLIVNNAMAFIPLLHLGSATIESVAPYRKTRKLPNGDKESVQIDLLIQTPRTAYVVEVKRKKEIGHEIISEMEAKLAKLPLRKGLSPRPVLIYDGEVDPSVTGTAFFDAVINAADLLRR